MYTLYEAVILIAFKKLSSIKKTQTIVISVNYIVLKTCLCIIMSLCQLTKALQAKIRALIVFGIE